MPSASAKKSSNKKKKSVAKKDTVVTASKGVGRKKARKHIEANITVRVNGRVAEHPVRNGLIATSFILCPLVGGLISSAITGSAMMNFDKLNQPPLAPPAWLFPVVWTILYLLMGVAIYLIYRIKPKDKKQALLKRQEMVLFFTQLMLNFMWTILFFRLEVRYFAFGWLLLMWMMILALIILAFKNQKVVAWCLMPYLAWCTFAAYLNIMIAVLN